MTTSKKDIQRFTGITVINIRIFIVLRRKKSIFLLTKKIDARIDKQRICVFLVISSPLAVLALIDPTNILQANNCLITNRYYMVYGSTLSFLIPFLIMAVTYVKTTQLLNKQAALLSQRADRFHNGLRRTVMPHRKLGHVR